VEVAHLKGLPSLRVKTHLPSIMRTARSTSG
jgi:hypothetical protein